MLCAPSLKTYHRTLNFLFHRRSNIEPQHLPPLLSRTLVHLHTHIRYFSRSFLGYRNDKLKPASQLATSQALFTFPTGSAALLFSVTHQRRHHHFLSAVVPIFHAVCAALSRIAAHKPHRLLH